MKKIILILAFFTQATALIAQTEEEPKTKGLKKENVFIGGNFGLAFGDYTLINVSPQIGYRFNKTLAAGIGLNFLYSSQKDYDYYGNEYSKLSQGIIGLNVFGRVYPIQNIMLQIQPEANYRFGNIKFYDGRQPEKISLDAAIVPSLLAGGGLVLPSAGGALIVSAMYDVLQNENSPYGKRPVINVGYNINLR